MNNPDISVIIPTSGRPEELELCLEALSRQSFINFEVIIVTDNIDNFQSLTDKYNTLNLFILQDDREGLTSARNMGLSHAKGKIVSFIDDDVKVSECWTKEIFNTFSSALDIGGVSGPTIIPLERITSRDILDFHEKIKKNIIWKIIGKIYIFFVLENQAYSVGKIFKSGAFSVGSNYIESTNLANNIEVDYLEACNMSYRKVILDKIGGFSPEYKGIGDWSEPDLAFRVTKAGYRLIFNSKAAVIHNISQKGVFNQRGKDSYQRMLNFINFYFRYIKANTPDKAMRFGLNLLFINLYWLYKYFQIRNPDWLLGIKGTLYGLGAQLCR